MKKSVFALVLTIACCACLIKETTHTLIIEQDGTVTWQILEDRVRSYSDDEETRVHEETAFADAAATGNSEIAHGLRLLGAIEVESTLLRDRRPMSALTRARFASAEELAQQILTALDISGEVGFSSSSEVQTLIIRIPAQEDFDGEINEAVLSLADDLESYRIALASGRFVSAAGFELDDSATVATPIPTEDDTDDNLKEAIELMLSWVNES